MMSKGSISRQSSIPRLSVPKARNSSVTPGSSRINSGLPKYRLPESVQKPGAKRKRSNSDRISKISLATAGRVTPNKFLTPNQNPNSQLLTASRASRASIDTQRSSFGGKIGSNAWPTDNPSFKKACVDKILEILLENNFDYANTRNKLRSPSKEDFSKIFTVIFQQIDPRFKKSKLEDQIPVIMQKMKYNIKLKKSSFLNVGSSFAWPSILAMLAWIVDSVILFRVINARVTAFQKEFPEEVNMSEIKFLMFINVFHCEDDEQEQIHIASYQSDVEAFHQVTAEDEQIVITEEKLLILELEKHGDWKEVLANLEHDYEQFKSDGLKLSKFIDDFHQFIGMKNSERANLNENLEALQEQLHQSVEESEKLKAVKDRQNLSALDLKKLKNNAKETATQLANLQEEMKRLNEQMWKMELDMSKAVKALGESSTKINVLTINYDMEEFQISTSDLRGTLPSWEGNVLPAVKAKKKTVQEERFQVENELLYLRKESEKMKEATKEKETLKHKLQGKFGRSEEEVQCLKREITQEENDLQAEFERIGGMVSLARRAPKDSLYEKKIALAEAKERLKMMKKRSKETKEKGKKHCEELATFASKEFDEREQMIANHQKTIEAHTEQHLEDCLKIIESINK